MSEAWLDTSALMDIEFRSSYLRSHVLALVPDQQPRITNYVLFELARGPFRRIVQLHNKAADLETYADLIQYINNCGVGSQRTASNMLAVVEAYQRHLQAGDIAVSPSMQLDHFRSWLAPFIRRGWRRAAKMLAANPIGCRESLPAPEERPFGTSAAPRAHLRHNLPSARCGHADNCRLLASVQQHSSDFAAMRDALDALPEKDAETSARIPALQRLLASSPNTPFQKKDCYRCSDAIIACEVPAGSTLVSKNEKHHRPLCHALKKSLCSYTAPSPSARRIPNGK